MNRKDLYRSMQDIDDRLLERSEKQSGSQRKIWFVWGAMAACLCLIIVVAMPYMLQNGEKCEKAEAVMEAPRENGPPAPQNGKTSDTYENLSELLAYLGKHDHHDGVKDTEGTGSALGALMESNGIALSKDQKYAYHIGTNAVKISSLGEASNTVGEIPEMADAVFVNEDTLIIVSQFQSGGDELNVEHSVRVCLYDIVDPQYPKIKDTFVQLGSLTSCWMVGQDLYLVTSDGVCACGWSRKEDPSQFYPQLTKNEEQIPWGDTDISILGKPSRVQYAAVSVFQTQTGKIEDQQAFYGDIDQFFYGEDWIAVTVDSHEVYTWKEDLGYTGVIHTDPDFEIKGVYKAETIYRIIGQEQNGNRLLFMTADPLASKTTVELKHRVAETPDIGYLTEILWEEDRAVIGVAHQRVSEIHDVDSETHFLIVEYDKMEMELKTLYEGADYLDSRVGSGYGNPLGHFETLIPLSDDLYVRYIYGSEGPGGFDVYQFSEMSIQGYRTEESLSGMDAYDYVWHVYDENTFGTLKVILGEEDSFRDVELSWCIYDVDPESKEIVQLIQEYPLDLHVKTYFGAEDIGFALKEVDGNLYYASMDMEQVQKIG